MSCNYFILNKAKLDDVTNNDNNQIITLNNSFNTFILPQNNINYYINHGLFEANLIEWSKQFCNKDKIMLDIGAHSGTYSIALSKYNKYIYAFEPQQMTYYALCGSVALSNLRNIKCINYGLGSTEQIGIKELYIVSNDGGGSTVIISNSNSSHILATEIIEIKTLDSFNIRDIGFIKMDVEENEINVLMGALETLKNSSYPVILFESNQKQNETDINYINTKLFSFLKTLSYKIVPITGISNMYLACH